MPGIRPYIDYYEDLRRLSIPLKTALIQTLEKLAVEDQSIDAPTPVNKKIKLSLNTSHPIVDHPHSLGKIIEKLHTINEQDLGIALNIIMEKDLPYLKAEISKRFFIHFTTIRFINELYSNHPTEEITLSTLLEKKRLDSSLFDFSATLSDPLSHHVRFIYRHIYSIPYPSHYKNKETDIARFHHGIQHVTRTAIYIPVLANLYRKYGDQHALSLTADDIQLLQIAALFHDAAREDEGEDKWDRDSASLLYYYLTRCLKVDQAKAIVLAEAIANKDLHPSGSSKMEETTKGIKWTWSKSASCVLEKNIWSKLIHDADCLDIMRARRHFNANYLDFYIDIASNPDHKEAKRIMTDLITEIRSLIATQGDCYESKQLTIKKQYECDDAYHTMNQTIGTYFLLSTLQPQLLSQKELATISPIDPIPYDESKGLIEANVKAALYERKIFARGIGGPSAIFKSFFNKSKETLGEREIRKIMREKGIPTHSSKENRSQKNGNPLRSASILGNTIVFANAGFLIINPPFDAIQEIHLDDIGSGWFKKKKYQATRLQTNPLTAQEKNDMLSYVCDQRNMRWGSTLTNYLEILLHITKVDAIYYSADPCLYNHVVFNQTTIADQSSAPTHPLAPFLQAAYLRELYHIQYEKNYEMSQPYYEKWYGKEKAREEYIKKHGPAWLPVFEYSGIHNYITAIPDTAFDREKIKSAWVTVCSAYMKEKLSSQVQIKQLLEMPVDEIKTLSVYYTSQELRGNINAPADACYDKDFQQELNRAIANEREELIHQQDKKIISKIESGNRVSVFDNELFFTLTGNRTSVFDNELFFTLIRYPSLSLPIQHKISAEINEKIKIQGDLSALDLTPYFPAIRLYVFANPDDSVWDNTAAKLYCLAKKINFNPLVIEVQKHAKTWIESILDTTNKAIENDSHPINVINYAITIENMTQFTILFDIASSPLFSSIDRAWHTLTNASLSFKPEEIKIIEFTRLIENLNKNNRLTLDYIKNAQSLCREINTHFLQTNDIGTYNIESLFKLNMLLKMDLDEIKSFIIQWLNDPLHMIYFNHYRSADPCHFMLTMEQILPLQTDFNLFKLLVEHFCFYSADAWIKIYAMLKLWVNQMCEEDKHHYSNCLNTTWASGSGWKNFITFYQERDPGEAITFFTFTIAGISSTPLPLPKNLSDAYSHLLLSNEPYLKDEWVHNHIEQFYKKWPIPFESVMKKINGLNNPFLAGLTFFPAPESLPPSQNESLYHTQTSCKWS